MADLRGGRFPRRTGGHSKPRTGGGPVSSLAPVQRRRLTGLTKVLRHVLTKLPRRPCLRMQGEPFLEVAKVGKDPVRADLVRGGVNDAACKGDRLVKVAVQQVTRGQDGAAEREAPHVDALGCLD